MENRTVQEANELLSQIDDSQRAGLVAASKDPVWLWPIVGVLAAAFVASFAIQSTVVSILAILFYIVGIGAVVGYAMRRRGVQPTYSSWPPSLRRVFAFYGVGVAVAVISVMAVGLATNFYWAALLTFFVVSIGGSWFHLRWRFEVEQLAQS
ncbi:MAG: hypothetical protein ACR2NL_05730 [Acidimicrobiia bacterium]